MGSEGNIMLKQFDGFALDRRSLYFGDNLKVLRTLDDNLVALCCTDPPFNSGRDYNIFLGADAQETAFKDTWKYDDVAIATRRDVAERAANQEDGYVAAERFLKGFDVMFDSPTRGKNAELRSYLTFMAPRIVEIRRVLKETGSFYLHCDPTASHYLKGLCDAIFGAANFRNEIVWHYAHMSATKRHFPRKHDIIFRYTKSNDWIFNTDDIRIPYAESSLNRVKYKGSGFAKKAEGSWIHKKGKIPDTVWDMPILKGGERLGYPTQKPRVLYERLIKASSNEGDTVLDAFCGCGTTIDAAETLKRGWIGIDLTLLALEPIQERMQARHHLKAFEDYPVYGYPVNLQEVKVMLANGENSQRYKDFEDWAVTRLGMKPTRYVGDGGIDGIGNYQLWHDEMMETVDTKAVCEVKSGKIQLSMVRAFRTAMNDAEATIGILIGLDTISAGIKQEMLKEGYYEHNGEKYPRLQYWQITNQYFENPDSLMLDINLPWEPEPIYHIEPHYDGEQQKLGL